MIDINREVETMAFVYHKDGKIKVLQYEDAKENQSYLIDNGWKHTATLNACVWIEHLFNNRNETDLLFELMDISKP